MKEIRIAIQSEDIKNIIDALDRIKEEIRKHSLSIPVYHNNTKYKYRIAIIEDAKSSDTYEKATSFNSNNSLESDNPLSY